MERGRADAATIAIGTQDGTVCRVDRHDVRLALRPVCEGAAASGTLTLVEQETEVEAPGVVPDGARRAEVERRVVGRGLRRRRGRSPTARATKTPVSRPRSRCGQDRDPALASLSGVFTGTIDGHPAGMHRVCAGRATRVESNLFGQQTASPTTPSVPHAVTPCPCSNTLEFESHRTRTATRKSSNATWFRRADLLDTWVPHTGAYCVFYDGRTRRRVEQQPQRRVHVRLQLRCAMESSS